MDTATFIGHGPISEMIQVRELGLAFVLSACIGLEREYRQKAAGFRTYTLVGVAAALFMLISKFGFDDVLIPKEVVVDPSRVAAQVVSGLGFIGGGVIFMRRDTVRGLTTAASVWLTAAIGMACGAGMLSVAVLTAVGYLVIMFLTPGWLKHFPRASQDGFRVTIRAQARPNLVDEVCRCLRQQGTTIGHIFYDQTEDADLIRFAVYVRGGKPPEALIPRLLTISGVQAAWSGTMNIDEV